MAQLAIANRVLSSDMVQVWKEAAGDIMTDFRLGCIWPTSSGLHSGTIILHTWYRYLVLLELMGCHAWFPPLHCLIFIFLLALYGTNFKFILKQWCVLCNKQTVSTQLQTAVVHIFNIWKMCDLSHTLVGENNARPFILSTKFYKKWTTARNLKSNLYINLL